jgi:hypothetical protein
MITTLHFDLQSFDRAVMNSSGEFDCHKNNTPRPNTASQISDERHIRPAALNHTPADELVVVPALGAVMLFLGAQLHCSVANRLGRARFSVDVGTADVPDLHAGRGAPLVDVDCTRTAIRYFRRVAVRTLRRRHGNPAVLVPSSRLDAGLYATDKGRTPCLIVTRSPDLASMEHRGHTRRAAWVRIPA